MILLTLMLSWGDPLPLGLKNLPETSVGHGNVSLTHLKLVFIFRSTFIDTGSMARWLNLPATGAHRDVSEGPTSRPVPLAALAEMPWLINVVVIEVTELSFHALASRTGYYLLCSLLHPLIFASLFSFVYFPTVQCNHCTKQLNPLRLLGHFRERERELFLTEKVLVGVEGGNISIMEVLLHIGRYIKWKVFVS